MKQKYLFLTITFIFLITLANCIKVKLNDVENFNINNKNKNNCDIKGFTANYVSNNIKILMSQFKSNAVPYTYHETGTMVVDYEKNMVLFDYHDTVDGSYIVGKSYEFYNNFTQYVYANWTGVEGCYVTSTQINILQKVTDSNKVGKIKVGSMNCDVYENDLPLFNYTTQHTVVDSSDCSIISIVYENNMLYKGQGSWDFYNYKPEVDSSVLQVPAICFEKK